MFQVKNISKSIGKASILRACSIEVVPGHFAAIVGPNGAGKSSLLKIMTGESKHYQGEVLINGKSISHYKHAQLSKIRAVLPQHTTVNFPFTVQQVIEIGRYPHQEASIKTQQVVGEVMELTQLSHYKDRSYQSLSGGEQQRVQMARAITQIWGKSDEAKYLLLDEPTSSLDLAQQHNLLSIAKDLCQQGIGVLAILHDLNLASQYADDILFLKKGNAIACGACEKVITQENIETTFSHPVRLVKEGGRTHIIHEACRGAHHQKACNSLTA